MQDWSGARPSAARGVRRRRGRTRTLRAAQVVVDEGLARPLLIGRAAVIKPRLEALGLRLNLATGAALRQGELFALISEALSRACGKSPA